MSGGRQMSTAPMRKSNARCAIALGFDCEMIGAYAGGEAATHGHLSAEVIRHIVDLCSLAEDHGARLQLFVLGMTFEQPVDFLREIVARGHDVDQHTYSHLPLIGTDRSAVDDEIARTSDAFDEHLGYRPIGLRGPGGYRNGIQDYPDVQAMILRQGLKFVSCDYSTRSRSHAYDKAADDNAARNLKHLQPRAYPTGLWELPITGYSDRHFLDSLEGALDAWIAHLKACIEFAYSLGGLIYAPGLHPHTHLRHDPEMRAMRAVFEYATAFHEPVAFITYREAYRSASGVAHA